jgi:ERCC4-related helicase
MTNIDINLESGDQVQHEKFGTGSVLLDQGATVIVRFEHGIESCEKSDLQQILSPLQAITQLEWHNPLEVITRIQAEAIQSINDAWGVFSLSRIALLPHQLWVCRQVLERWPTRWLVADDVGLGKTIEAGLILSPIIARGTAKRVLVICPASLVEQWQNRLYQMFDLRFTRYIPELDTSKIEFWNIHSQVVVSLQTLRADSNNRHDRFFSSDPWDLVFVDEAHHLNADEKGGATLGYALIERLVRENRVSSMVFFTGTPHRGKNFGFLSLLKLLRPDLFDPQKSFRSQLPWLREVMIRNNKQSVTDLSGQRLFQQPMVMSETYQYSPTEAHFYQTMTEFILTGKTYAASLSTPTQGQAVMLVLYALQKLASSSVAAIRRTLRRRLELINQRKLELKELTATLARYQEYEQVGDNDQVSALEEKIAELSVGLQLMEDEEVRLRELVAAANQVRVETKIDKIIHILKERFPERPILFFTEYKATQALLMSALMKNFGDDCVTFINGDERIDDVIDNRGRSKVIQEKRENAAAKFNAGEVRFLVSTEAGGEGIDLQERCHSLIHVDLPWNPMRLHQRVGRLNRYGQTRQVEVVTLRNPDTVEAAIWDKLNSKIDQINLALDQVMDDPEDMLQLVLGMTSPNVFREVFADADRVKQEALSDWFDQKTAQFGGRDAIEMVRELVGHSARFDFQQVAGQIPRLDLPALRPFLISMLTLNQRQVRYQEDGRISFITPEAWLQNEPGIRRRYDRMIFDRNERGKDALSRILGVGHRVVDKALVQAKANSACVLTLPTAVMTHPLFVFRLIDRVTGTGGVVRAVIAAVELNRDNVQSSKLLPDWQLLEHLNTLSEGRGVKHGKNSLRPADLSQVILIADQAKQMLETQVTRLDLPFKIPAIELRAILWPIPSGQD